MPVPLKLLHSQSLVDSKLDKLRRMSTEEIVDSLRPGAPQPLRVKEDGTVVEGNHRIFILLERAFDVDGLPREPA